MTPKFAINDLTRVSLLNTVTFNGQGQRLEPQVHRYPWGYFIVKGKLPQSNKTHKSFIQTLNRLFSSNKNRSNRLQSIKPKSKEPEQKERISKVNNLAEACCQGGSHLGRRNQAGEMLIQREMTFLLPAETLLGLLIHSNS